MGTQRPRHVPGDVAGPRHGRDLVPGLRDRARDHTFAFVLNVFSIVPLLVVGGTLAERHLFMAAKDYINTVTSTKDVLKRIAFNVFPIVPLLIAATAPPRARARRGDGAWRPMQLRAGPLRRLAHF